MTTTKFATFAGAVASALPSNYPQYWVGVTEVIPNWERDCITVKEAEVVGNLTDGFEVHTHEHYRRIIRRSTCLANAREAVDPNAGHRDTGWYRQEVIETGVSVRSRRVTVITWEDGES